ncbi:HAMP domain-containing histidine kinase [Peptacetobacter hiranonis]|uniref:sensor histidine kinase n=1 Tax=Peptacetobacter hiranonis TaxID=89152 RepID=UPI0019171243|nr:HAMP domain-containing sensor histidine kinase [Peptacetobacter hiranonis]QQQ87541.1 HAMP domain-containing histidine kinase [Peptacetobacter hiranonis]
MIRKVFSEIKNDSFLRKCAVVSFAMFLAFFISVLSVESVLFEKITEDRYKHDAAVVGYLLEKYPQDREIIVKSVIGDNNKYIESGANTLAKYGYTSKTSDLIDKSENKVKMMIIFFVFLFAVFSIIILVVAIKAMGYVLKIFEAMYSKMKNIFNTVDNIKHSNPLNKNDNKTDNALQERESIENDSVDLNKYNENLLCRINMISEKAERNMRINMRKIENEKENVKSLVTDISHQLKTPLANVELYNTLLAEEGISDEERLEFLETEGIAIEKLKMLIDSLINISRLEADMISIDKKEENLKECIESAISSVKADAAKKNITIKNEIKEDCILAIDRKWTTEAIFNLLDNAVKYTAPNGKINLSLDNGINYFALNIEDNGIGIDTDEYNDIFKRFYRSRNDIVQNEKGSGVGLYLVRKIMNLQDGNVMVSSEKGKGSTFTLYFSKSKGE